MQLTCSLLIEQFICREDNFAVILHDTTSHKTLAIDAPDGTKILHFLKQRGWGLDYVLITHHHGDHTAGISELKRETGAKIIGPEAEFTKIAGLDVGMCDDEICYFASHPIQAIATPGHTAGALSYYWPQDDLLFTGDTLFSLGCGRLFECEPHIMLNSLKKLRALPAKTLIYCGHEYTRNNGYFALSVDGKNSALHKRMRQIEELTAQGLSTLPVTLESELFTNPFLRYDDRHIRDYLQMPNNDELCVFAELRQRKDVF